MQAKGSANIENGRETTTAGVVHYSWIEGSHCGRTAKESRGTTKNTEELANPNVDLVYGTARTYWCWRAAEMRRGSLVKTGRCSGLGWCRRDARRRRRSSGSGVLRGGRRWKGKSDEDLRVRPIYKGRLMSGREKRGG